MPEAQTTIDPDTAQLMRDLEQGLKEAQAGVYAQVHTPDDIARRKRGRPMRQCEGRTQRARQTSWMPMCWPLCGPLATAGKPASTTHCVLHSS